MSTVPPRIRVLVVDDSAFARKVLRLALSSDPRIEVVGTASDGLDALEKIADLKPDVVTLDIIMPELDGVAVLRALESTKTRPTVVLVTTSDEENELIVEALQLGAVDMVKKPTALATDRLYDLSAELVTKVVRAAGARPPTVVPLEANPILFGAKATAVTVLVIGASTGGPQALSHLVSRLPGNFPVPVVIGLHIPAEYTTAIAKRMNQTCALEVVEASDGMPLKAGLVMLAPGGAHLTLRRSQRGLTARVSTQPASALYFPSIDLLFESAAVLEGAGVLGVVLTGMGEDGTRGARAIVAAGGRVLTEAESSCIVYGMPRAVKEAGLSAGEAPIESMTEAVIKAL